MPLKKRLPTALLTSIAVSLALHIALALVLAKAGDTGVAPYGNSAGKLEATISITNMLPDPQQATKVNHAMFKQMNSAISRAGYSNLDGEQSISEEQFGTSVEEKPVLLYVREINLNDAIDLTEDGFVEVELLISPDGRVLTTSLISTDIPTEFFELVTQVFADAEFSPGKKNGIPVFYKFRIKIIFGKSYSH
jgi:hypothetical protein